MEIYKICSDIYCEFQEIAFIASLGIPIPSLFLIYQGIVNQDNLNLELGLALFGSSLYYLGGHLERKLKISN